uniref:Transmembrane protein n=1 Tax=Syphacia muris TaxID=451379 RepID=A0A0N5B0F8_9BILA
MPRKNVSSSRAAIIESDVKEPKVVHQRRTRAQQPKNPDQLVTKPSVPKEERRTRSRSRSRSRKNSRGRNVVKKKVVSTGKTVIEAETAPSGSTVNKEIVDVSSSVPSNENKQVVGDVFIPEGDVAENAEILRKRISIRNVEASPSTTAVLPAPEHDEKFENSNAAVVSSKANASKSRYVYGFILTLLVAYFIYLIGCEGEHNIKQLQSRLAKYISDAINSLKKNFSFEV